MTLRVETVDPLLWWWTPTLIKTLCLQERGGTNMWCGNYLFNSTPCKIWGKYIYDSCFLFFVYSMKKRKSDCQKPSIHSSELDITWCTICYNASTSVDIWPWWWWILVFLAVWFLFLKGSRERKTVKVSRLVLWSLSLTRLSMPRRGLYVKDWRCHWCCTAPGWDITDRQTDCLASSLSPIGAELMQFLKLMKGASHY